MGKGGDDGTALLRPRRRSWNTVACDRSTTWRAAKMCGIDDPYVFVAIVIAMTWWVLCLRFSPRPPHH